MRHTLPWLMHVDTPAEGGGDEPVPSPEQPDEGFPEGIAIADMTDAQRAAYWKRYARRDADRLRAMSDYDQLKAKAAQLEKLQAEQMSDQEKAVNAAREEGRQAAAREANEAAAKAILRGALAARGVKAEDVDRHTRYTAVTAFVTDSGVDEQELLAYAATLTGPAAPAVPDMGQGRRGPSGGPSQRELGVAAARRRHKLPDPT